MVIPDMQDRHIIAILQYCNIADNVNWFTNE